MKRILFSLLTLTALAAALTLLCPAARAETLSGPMGANVTGEFDVNYGDMTVSGSGPMSDLAGPDESSWYSEEDGMVQSLTVEEGVTSVGDYAFHNFRGVRYVSLSQTITSIGTGAFFHCSSLPELNLPDGVTSVGDLAFAECTNLRALYLPSKVQTLGADVFDRCGSLTEIFYGGTEQQWADLTKDVTLPDSLEAVHYGSRGIIRQGSCGEHLTWTLDETGTLTIRGTGGMEDYGWYDGENHQPSWNRSAVCRVVLDEGVTGVGAFAFDSCSNLTSVSLPSTLETIGADAFAFCPLLEPPTLPSKLTYIGDHAFWFCEAFQTITIPASVTEVGVNPFPKCHNLREIIVEEGCTACRFTDGVLYSGDGKTLICYPTSGQKTSFTVPEGVTAIGEMAFFAEGQLEHVTIPEGVTEVGRSAFTGLASLTRLDLPLSLKSVGEDGFGYCSELTDVWYAGEKSDWGAISFGEGNEPVLNARKHFSNGETDLAIIASGECGKEDGAVTWTLDGLGTLHITGKGQLCSTPQMSMNGSYCILSPWWEYRESIRRIVIDEGVTYISFHNFRDCPNLTSVVLPITIINIGIDQWAFYNDKSLTDVYFRGNESQWKIVTIRTASVPITGQTDKNDLYIKNATVHYEYDETKQPEPDAPAPELTVPMVDPEARTMTLTASTDQPASAIFAVFDVNGKLLKTELATLEAGETRELEFSPDGPQDSAALQGDISDLDESALICKVFLLGQEGHAPLCDARTAVMD